MRCAPFLALFLVLLLATAGCAREPRLERELLVFGTTAELDLRGPGDLAAAADAVQRRFGALESEWHPWRESSLRRLNAALAAGTAHDSTPAVVDLIEASLPLVAASAGAFDPAAGALVAAWGFHTDDWPARMEPDRAAIDAFRAARPRLGSLRIDGLRVHPGDRGLQLDFNAIAEGAAAAQALGLLRGHGVRHALLDLGGDVVALGDAGGRAWRVALRDPRGGVLGWSELRDGEALFASGSYSKFREDGTRRRPHLVDPRSGEPVEGSAASAVLAHDPLLADAAATALMVGGAAGFEGLVHGLGLRCALLLTSDDRLYLTAAMARRLALLRQPAGVDTITPDGECATP